MRAHTTAVLILSLLAAGCAGLLPETDAPQDPGNGDSEPGAGSNGSIESPANPDGQVLWRGDLQRTAYYPNQKVPENVELEHRVPGFNSGDHTAAKGSAIVVNDTILVGTDAGRLYRVAMNGTILWETQVTDANRGIHGTPAVVNGTAYIGAYDGILYAFNVSDGEEVWSVELGDAIGASPLVYEGLVWISVETYEPSGRIAAVNASSGELVWMDKRITNHPHSSVAIDAEEETIVVGSNDGWLYAWNLTLPEPEFAWKYPTGKEIKGPIAIHEGIAVAGSWDNRVHAVYVDNGTQVWAAPTGSDVMSGAAIDHERDWVYIGGHDRFVRALDLFTGEIEWLYKTDGWIVSSPMIAGDTVVVGSHDEDIHALDAATGELIWEYPTEGWTSSSAIVHDERVIMLDRADEGPGSLWILGPAEDK